MRDGTEHRLTTDNVPVVPGSQRTDMWLRELADYLNVAVPTESRGGLGGGCEEGNLQARSSPNQR